MAKGLLGDDLTPAPKKRVAPPKPRGTIPVRPDATPAGAVVAARSGVTAEETAPKPSGRFSVPTITMAESKPRSPYRSGSAPKPVKPNRPIPEYEIMKRFREIGSDQPRFNEHDWEEYSGGAVGLDVECFDNFFLICLERFNQGQSGDGKRITFEQSDRSDIDKERLTAILKKECIVTFNGMTYDLPMIALMLQGVDCGELKRAGSRIILQDIKHWKVNEEIGVRRPLKINHIDLMEPNASVRGSLKVLHGRLHGKFIMDLPFPPDKYLSPADMNLVTLYCFNDLDATRTLFYAVKEPLLLRYDLTARYGIDMRSKSDAQVGEAIVRKRVEDLTGRKLRYNADQASISSFKYDIPDFISFEYRQLNKVLEVLADTTFHINASGRVDKPATLELMEINIGTSTYKMGVGGLHSTESNRAVHSDEENVLIDADVSSQYPNIMLKLAMYPKMLGKTFIEIYDAIVRERLDGKKRLKEIDNEIAALKEMLK